jgi:hypothetical protein
MCMPSLSRPLISLTQFDRRRNRGTGTEQGHGSMATEGADADCRSAAKREGGEWEGGGEKGGEGGGEGAGGGRRSGGRGDGIGGRNPKVPDISCPAAGPITSGIIQCCKIISFFSHSKILKFLNPPFLVKSRALAVRSLESLQQGRVRPSQAGPNDLSLENTPSQ